MISCGKVRKLLSSYLERELEPLLQEEVQEHIKFCSDCFEREQAVRTLLNLTQNLEPTQPASNFSEQLFERLNSSTERSPRRGRSVPIFRRWIWAVPATVAAALLVFFLNHRPANLPVEVSAEKPTAAVEAEQNSNVPDQNVIPEGQVEFVMDNWDQRLLQNVSYPEQSGADSQALLVHGFRLAGPTVYRRVYVMPVVQNQMAGYRTKKPY